MASVITEISPPPPVAFTVAAAAESGDSTGPQRAACGESHLRSFAKAVSWRCVGTLDTFVVSFVVLTLTGAVGSGVAAAAKVSSGIAAVEVVTKVVLYYLHERAWARVRFGKGRGGRSS